MIVYAVISAAIILAAGGQEQELVLVYAVAVFVSFLAGLLAMARFSRRRGARLFRDQPDRRRGRVAFTLVVNLTRGYPLISIAGTVLIGGFLNTAGFAPGGRAGSRRSSGGRGRRLRAATGRS